MLYGLGDVTGDSSYVDAVEGSSEVHPLKSSEQPPLTLVMVPPLSPAIHICTSFTGVPFLSLLAVFLVRVQK